MLKPAILMVLALAVQAAAQSGTTPKPSPTPQPVASGPTKVTGEGTKTASGLQYWDIKVGTGKTVQNGDAVKVEYTGWLTNGKKFDSSVGGPPFEVKPVGTAPVIKGWNEGLVGMKVGGKRQLRIPPDLAYGPSGYPPVIPPNSTLIFDVTVVSVQ
jgi:FKBP-type peptidyl-prolyl cis-trans isomerase